MRTNPFPNDSPFAGVDDNSAPPPLPPPRTVAEYKTETHVEEEQEEDLPAPPVPARNPFASALANPVIVSSASSYDAPRIRTVSHLSAHAGNDDYEEPFVLETKASNRITEDVPPPLPVPHTTPRTAASASAIDSSNRITRLSTIDNIYESIDSMDANTIAKPSLSKKVEDDEEDLPAIPLRPAAVTLPAEEREKIHLNTERIKAGGKQEEEEEEEEEQEEEEEEEEEEDFNEELSLPDESDTVGVMNGKAQHTRSMETEEALGTEGDNVQEKTRVKLEDWGSMTGESVDEVVDSESSHGPPADVGTHAQESMSKDRESERQEREHPAVMNPSNPADESWARFSETDAIVSLAQDPSLPSALSSEMSPQDSSAPPSSRTLATAPPGKVNPFAAALAQTTNPFNQGRSSSTSSMNDSSLPRSSVSVPIFVAPPPPSTPPPSVASSSLRAPSFSLSALGEQPVFTGDSLQEDHRYAADTAANVNGAPAPSNLSIASVEESTTASNNALNSTVATIGGSTTPSLSHVESDHSVSSSVVASSSNTPETVRRAVGDRKQSKEEIIARLKAKKNLEKSSGSSRVSTPEQDQPQASAGRSKSRERDR